LRLYRPKWKRADGEAYECPKWYVQFHLNGKLFRRALGTTDKRVAQEKAMTAFRLEERRAAGMLDPAEEHRDKPLADHLADLGVVLVGLDTDSMDASDSKDLASHHRLCARGVAILEGIDLSGIVPGVYDLVALPLRLVGADASPVRAVLVERETLR